MKSCTIPGCSRRTIARGFCSPHWQRWHKHGDAMPSVAIGDKTGSLNPRWKGGEISDGRGRVLIYSPGHPNPSYCGTHVYRYRLVMEKHLGRFLRSDEIVHHINENPADDRPENLQVMTQSEHAKLHQNYATLRF